MWNRMRTNLVSGAMIGRHLAAIVALAVISPVVAQEFRSLPGAVTSGGGEVWSSGESTGAIAGPSLADEYLEPIAAEDNPLGAVYPGDACSSCNSDEAGGVRSFYNRCGCDNPQFPWFTGPGNCDTWCVGPHWNVEVDGMFIRRDDADWGDVVGAAVVDQFNYGPGARIFATGYNYSNYGVQIGYEGVNDFHSTAVLGTEDITYQSTLNSLEVNLIRRRDIPLKIFAGGRYIEIDEDFVRTDTVAPPDPASGDFVGTFVENRLYGFQIGAQRDAWQLNRWVTIEPFGNAGAYFNDFKREDVDFDASDNVQFDEKNEFSEIAFLGEAGVTSVLRINSCLALRGGYQVMAFSGVANALDTAQLPNGFDPGTLIYHGARFGIEYQR
jgi:hypothetical protein